MEKVSPTFHFEAWRDASPTNESGKSDAGIKVELGGRIVQATKNGKGIVIVAEQLPIVSRPVYGPMEDVKRNGDHEFAFLYPGELEPLDLMKGNRFIMVGTTTSRRPVLVNGIPKTEPFLIADCIHVWQTGGAEISEFKEDVGGGFSTLPGKDILRREEVKGFGTSCSRRRAGDQRYRRLSERISREASLWECQRGEESRWRYSNETTVVRNHRLRYQPWVDRSDQSAHASIEDILYEKGQITKEEWLKTQADREKEGPKAQGSHVHVHTRSHHESRFSLRHNRGVERQDRTTSVAERQV